MQTTGPLAGVKVLDLSSVILGPYISQLMADWGAEVIKIEAPSGDTTRNLATAKNPGMSAMFMNMNRNKRSLVLDLKKPESQEILARLIAESDILVHNYRPRPAKELGLAYDQLCKINPKLITCIAVGYGRGGRYSERPAYDDLIQGISGMADLIGQYTQSSPAYVPTALADKVGSLMSLSGILAALYKRERTGEGEEVEVPMFETLASFLMVEHLTGPAYEPPLGPAGYIRQMAPTRRPFKTKDGFISALPYTDRHWRSFFTITGCAELADDSRFKHITNRTEHTAELYQLVETLLMKETTAYWLKVLEENDIPFAPISTLDDLLNDPHLQDVGFFEQYDHPTEGRLRRVTSPVKFSKSTPEFQFGAPHLGENSREILLESGFDEQQIDAFIESGVTAS
jgi:crotonobetainyl-CoA:carnitine CoA-transferase CaiB-like acyl-CoA transferase